MEKLQQALQKARTQRTASGAMAGAVDQPPKAVSSDAESADAWAAIQQADLVAELLVRNRVVSYQYSRETNHFDILRTKLLLQMNKHAWRRVAVTSPTPVCGKSTIVSNLTLGLARQSDIRTIAVELDLRNPSISRMLGVKPPHDITRMLAGEVAFSDQALRVHDNVAISIASGPSSDPTRYFLSEKLEASLAEIEHLFEPDLMIFDVPPFLTGDDTRALLRHVDCALLVARAEATTVGQIDSCEREIAEQTNVLGVVLNQCRYEDEATGYGYGYPD